MIITVVVLNIMNNFQVAIKKLYREKVIAWGEVRIYIYEEFYRLC